MKLELDIPFKEEFKAGYLNMNKEPRRVVLLVRKDNTKTSTSYARYLMSCKLGRRLRRDEHVDHIDHDPLNDVIDNLQILSPAKNNKKKNKHLSISRTMMTLSCPICGNEFTREARQLKIKIKNGKTPTCSRSCGGKMSAK